MLYQGGFSRERGIEQLIEALPAFPDAHGPRASWATAPSKRSCDRAAADAGRSPAGSIVLPAVPPTELLDWVASADVVAMPIQPSTLNHRLTTPNKLFEAMAAGVPVVASDLPGMAGIVRETGCGVLCDPTSSAAIAAAIRSILDAPAPTSAPRSGSGRSRPRTGEYNWEAQVEILLAEYGRLTGRAVVSSRGTADGPRPGGRARRRPGGPYSRAIRIARALAAEGYEVEIAAVAAPGLREREPWPGRSRFGGDPAPDPGRVGVIELRRYRPSGAWAIAGASEAATGGSIDRPPRTRPGAAPAARRSRARLAAPRRSGAGSSGPTPSAAGGRPSPGSWPRPTSTTPADP